MKLLKALLEAVFGEEQCGGETCAITIHMVDSERCSHIDRVSTAGGDRTEIQFRPALPLEEALLHARKYNRKGSFTHGSGERA